MVDIPRDARLALFRGFLRRGAVIRVEQYPFLYTGPRDKFLVLLNLRFSVEAPLYCVLTTSHPERNPFPHLALVVPRGTIPFFPDETAIQCREVHPVDYAFLAERYADGRLTFVGALPDEIIAQLNRILGGSPYLAPAIARDILV